MQAVVASGQTTVTRQPFSLMQVDNPNVILETVKKAEQDEAVIIRLYEASGGEQAVTVRLALKVKAAYLTNLLEDEREALAVEHDAIRLTLRGFEIAIVKLVLSSIIECYEIPPDRW